jgi:iron complex transport system substrate-binding protein
MRIVSLLSSATEIVFALGLQDRLVGISHECDHPPAALDRPRLSRSRFDPAGMSSGEIDAAVARSMEEHGSVYEVDARELARLRPDLILTQAVCEVCAVPTGSVEAAVAELPGDPMVLSLDAHTIGGILGTIREVAEAAAVGGRGREVVEALSDRIDGVRSAVAGAEQAAVLALEWLDPPFAPGHWVPEMVEAAGGANLLGTAGAASVRVGWDEVPAGSADALLLIPCGYDIPQAREDADAHAARLRQAAGGVIDAGRAWIGAGAYFSRSGPRVVDGIEALAAALHPDRVPAAVPGRLERWP